MFLRRHFMSLATIISKFSFSGLWRGVKHPRESFSAHRSKPSAFGMLRRQFVSAFLGTALPELAWLPLTASISHCVSCTRGELQSSLLPSAGSDNCLRTQQTAWALPFLSCIHYPTCDMGHDSSFC